MRIARRTGGHLAAVALAMTVAACTTASLATPAVPRQPLLALISQDDYPAAARRYELQGQAKVVLSVNAEGRVSGCRVAMSSGHAVLDVATCRILQSRARFEAARDRKGGAVASEYPATVRWTLPGAPVG